LTIAATQMACTTDVAANLDGAEHLVREAAARDVKLVLPQELFATPYFCKDQTGAYFDLAEPLSGSRIVARFAALAKELGVVIPISFFEKAGQNYFNSLAVADADGKIRGCYRKSHIPDGPGYHEKYYFTPGNTGFMVFDTAVGRVGAGICWDQWYPECARALALLGAEVICYPTAIGSEPQDPTLDTMAQWQRVMQGHAAANMVPIVAANRVGVEQGASCSINFYGSSFVTDHTGEILGAADRSNQGMLHATVDLDAAAAARREFGLFRDRRPDLYAPLLGHDGQI
jgi:N-carbamoylputrescine amidase